ncbi:MAG TPA: hypothetical protein VNJ04_09560 [Gemmatimonadaceae bacterium]|nr:hypothetical protein [Gemmatimonadaceae bacterium]
MCVHLEDPDGGVLVDAVYVKQSPDHLVKARRTQRARHGLSVEPVVGDRCIRRLSATAFDGGRVRPTD